MDQDNAARVKKSGYKSGYNSDLLTGGEEGKDTGKRFPRTDARYWRKRVFRHCRRVDGAQIEDKHYSARIAYNGRRETFNTGENEKATAAGKAAEIYRVLDRGGWEAALERFKPAKVKPIVQGVPVIESPTVGQYLRLVEEWAGLSPMTLSGYSRMLRLVAAGIAGIKRDANRFDAHAGGGGAKWRAKVDAVPLETFTKQAVQKWRLAFVAKAGAEPTAQVRAKISCNSVLSQARALFSKRILALVRSRVALPEPLPFDGVEKFTKLRSHLRYQSKVDAASLLGTARDELAVTEPEQFKILVLALCCGLRRNELDKLTWRQVDFDAGVIRIETTRYFKAKSDESNATVDVEPELVAVLRGWKARAKSEFVIESSIRPRMGTGYAHYRTAQLLESLTAWLRSKGLDDRKPLHTLRKEFGSIVADKLGIYAASRALRHADVQVTAMHYLDKKQRIATGLGAVLTPTNVQTVDFAGATENSGQGKARRGQTRRAAH